MRRFTFGSFDDSQTFRIYRLSLIVNIAACPVRLQFFCDKAAEGLSFNNPVLESLITAYPKVVKNLPSPTVIGVQCCPSCKSTRPVVAQCPMFWVSCGSPITTVLQTPKSHLHKTRDPHVEVIGNGVYERVKRETQSRQVIREERLDAGAVYEAEVGGIC